MYRNSGGGYFYTYKKDSLNRPIIRYLVHFGGDSTKIVCSYNNLKNTKIETYLDNYNNSIIQSYNYYYMMHKIT